MKNLFLVVFLLSFLLFQIALGAGEYKEYAEKWYFDLNEKFNKEQKRFIIEQLALINQFLLGLQETILNKINEDHYISEDELKISDDIINSLKKEKEKPLFQKLKSFYNAYGTYKMFRSTKKIIPCIINIFKFVCEKQYKNKEEIEKIIQNLIFVFSLKAEASDEKIRSLLSIVKPVQQIFSEILILDKSQQESYSCIIL